MTSRRRACIVCGAPATEGSRCAVHQRRKRPWIKSRPNEYGHAWAQRRKQVLLEEKICRYCGAPATEVDHIVPRAEGGTEDRSNLQAICSADHKVKTMAEAARGSRRRKWSPPA